MCSVTIKNFIGLAKFAKILLTYTLFFFLCSHCTNWSILILYFPVHEAKMKFYFLSRFLSLEVRCLYLRSWVTRHRFWNWFLAANFPKNCQQIWSLVLQSRECKRETKTREKARGELKLVGTYNLVREMRNKHERLKSRLKCFKIIIWETCK